MVVGGWWNFSSSRQGCSWGGLTVNCEQLSSRAETVAEQLQGAGAGTGAGVGAGAGAVSSVYF